MSEFAKAIMSTIVIVACLALLGVMVYLKVPEVGLVACGIITTIVAWLSRTPDRKDPPPGATAIPLLAAGALLASILACGCKDPTSPQNVENAAAVAQYELLLKDCRDQGKAAGSYAAYEACANAVDHKLCAQNGLRCSDGGAK